MMRLVPMTAYGATSLFAFLIDASRNIIITAASVAQHINIEGALAWQAGKKRRSVRT